MGNATRTELRGAGPSRVLLADPDHDSRLRCCETFRRAGCDVLEAVDGREALVAALVRSPSLIVLNTRLPLVAGPALCEILRRDSLTRGVPILALVDGGATAEAERFRRAGADPCSSSRSIRMRS